MRLTPVNQFLSERTPVQKPKAALATDVQKEPLSADKPGLLFSGLHPDAAMGVEVKVAGTRATAENSRRLWFKLRDQKLVDRRTYQTHYPLQLIRDRKNPHDPNAIGIYNESDPPQGPRRIGYVPADLARHIAPLMDDGHQFQATLTQMSPYKRDGQFHYSMVTRLEYVAKPGRAPNQRVLRKVEDAFNRARDTQKHERVLALLPEEMNVHALPGKRGKLVERIDHEQGTISYYRKGHLLANFKLDDTHRPQPEYERKTLPAAIREQISRLLDRRG